MTLFERLYPSPLPAILASKSALLLQLSYLDFR